MPAANAGGLIRINQAGVAVWLAAARPGLGRSAAASATSGQL
jgi:hypothetical protein